MNKYVLLVIIVMGLISVSFAGGLIIDLITSKDVFLDYPTTKINDGFVKDDMLMFNDVNYVVIGDKIVLNKKDLFQNKEVTLLKNTCLEYDSNYSESLELVCLKYTTFSKDELIEETLRKEFEFIKSVFDERQLSEEKIVSDKGLVKISSELTK